MAEYIEREATVLSLLDKGQHSHRYKLGEIWELDFEEIREAIKSIPAADVRPVVKARWNVGADGWECSNCTIESNNTYPICPYCGAEMRGEQDV